MGIVLTRADAYHDVAWLKHPARIGTFLWKLQGRSSFLTGNIKLTHGRGDHDADRDPNEQRGVSTFVAENGSEHHTQWNANNMGNGMGHM